MIVETSIIVRTFNEEKHLDNLFDGFDRQTYRDFEVIVVDSGSFDSTRDIANQGATYRQWGRTTSRDVVGDVWEALWPHG